MATDRTEGPDSIPYTQDGNHSEGGASAFASEAASAPKKKGMGNLILLGVGAVFVLFVAFVGYKMLSGNRVPQQQPAPAAPVVAQPATQDNQEQPAVGEPSLVPLDPNAAGLDPATGLPVAPQPETTMAVDPNTPTQSNIDPITGLPTAESASAPAVPAEVTSPDLNATPADPMTSPAQPATPEPVTPAVVEPVATTVAEPAPAPVATDVPAGSIDQLRTDILGALDRFQQSLTALDKRVDDRFADVERRLAALEGNRAAASATPKPATTSSKPRRKPVVHRKPKPRPAPVNRVEIISRGDTPAAPQVIAAPAKATAEPGCKIASIQPGRFWVRRQDGSFSTYGVDDRIDGGRVTRVDPDAGVYVDGRRWNCGGH